MKEIDHEKIVIYCVSVLLVIGMVPLLARLPRTRGKNLIYHAAFACVASLILFLLPNDIQHEIFSPGGVIVIGTVLPIYESIKAVCTTTAPGFNIGLLLGLCRTAPNLSTKSVIFSHKVANIGMSSSFS